MSVLSSHLSKWPEKNHEIFSQDSGHPKPSFKPIFCVSVGYMTALPVARLHGVELCQTTDERRIGKEYGRKQPWPNLGAILAFSGGTEGNHELKAG
jgi:hypothetical protein